jgi:hypothetical protein
VPPRSLLATCLLLPAGCADLAVGTPTPARCLAPCYDCPAPGEHYYVLVFASQDCLRRPRYTHTWATVVRATGCPPAVEQATISWMPATLTLHPLWPLIEPGVNLGPRQTLDVVLRKGEQVTLWGPYECRPALYRRFLAQKAFLDSGRVGYQCDDDLGEAALTGEGCNCIHALTDMDPQFGRGHYPLTRYGEAAGEYIAAQLRARGALADCGQTHDWVLGALGLDGYPLTRR